MLLTSKTLVIRSIVVTPDKPNRVVIGTDDFGVRMSENLGTDFNDSHWLHPPTRACDHA
jgi:hypothetical protein